MPVFNVYVLFKHTQACKGPVSRTDTTKKQHSRNREEQNCLVVEFSLQLTLLVNAAVAWRWVFNNSNC